MEQELAVVKIVTNFLIQKKAGTYLTAWILGYQEGLCYMVVGLKKAQSIVGS
jgi:hypothetical protein